MLRLDHVSKNQLQDLNIAFRSNELVQIVISNDDMRKVVFDLIAGIEHYDQGDILLNDFSTKWFKKKQWNIYRKCCVSIVSLGQMNDTILQTVMMGLVFQNLPASLKQHKAKNALLQVGLQDGYHRLVNELSMYEKYCLAIAKAIVSDTKIILIDQMSEGLSQEENRAIYNLLNEIADEHLVIVFEKEEKNYDVDRCIIFEDGNINFDSNPFNWIKKEKGVFALPSRPIYLNAIFAIFSKNTKKHPFLALGLLILMALPYYHHLLLFVSIMIASLFVTGNQRSELLLLKRMGASFLDVCKVVNFELSCLFIGATVLGLLINGNIVSFMIIYYISLIIINTIIVYFRIERGII